MRNQEKVESMERDPIRVMLGITDLEVGGAEKCLTELACRVDSQRFRLSVVSLAPYPRKDDRLVKRIREHGIPVRFLDGCKVWDSPKALMKWLRCILRDRPHVVQTFLFHANLLGRMVARIAGVPAVISGIRVAERQANWHLLLDAATSGWVDRYVCVSRAVADFSVSRGLLPADKIVVIPNGVDVGVPAVTGCAGVQGGNRSETSENDEKLAPRSRRRVTFVGRLARQKGVDLLLHSAAQWLRSFPDVVLYLVGDGPQREWLMDLSIRLGISDRIVWAGYCENVGEILRETDVFVLPSRWEGMPNALLEAMAMGCPVVVTAVEGVSEVLGDEEPLQIVRPGDSAALSRAIVRLLSNPTLTRELGERNRTRVQRCFGWDCTVKEYEQLWAEQAAARAGC